MKAPFERRSLLFKTSIEDVIENKSHFGKNIEYVIKI